MTYNWNSYDTKQAINVPFFSFDFLSIQELGNFTEDHDE